MFNMDHLPAEIADSARFHLYAGQLPEDAFRLAGEDHSPEVIVNANGEPQLVWWPSSVDEIDVRQRARWAREHQLALVEEA